MCDPATLTNTLVPQSSLSSILQNQVGVALDALTTAVTLAKVKPYLSQKKKVYFFAQRSKGKTDGWKTKTSKKGKRNV